MEYIIICDFDGTITTQDTGQALLTAFAPEKWKEYDEYVINGEMGTREALKNQYGLIKEAKQEEFDRVIDTIKIDQTFYDFYDWLKEQSIDFYILSDGFKEYIEKILQNNNLQKEEIKIIANSMKIEEGKVVMEFGTEPCSHGCANCKHSFVKELKKKNISVIYVGDGLSDILPAQIANFVFAKRGRSLESIVVENNNDKTRRIFDSFDEIKEILEKELKI